MITKINGLPKANPKISLYFDDEMIDDDIKDDKKPALNSSGILSLKKQTETGEALEDINKSKKEAETGMNSIDMRTRTSFIQFQGLTKWDIINDWSIIPDILHHFPIQAKRNLVSIEGFRSEQMKDIAIGISNKKTNQGMFSKMMNVFSPKDEGLK